MNAPQPPAASAGLSAGRLIMLLFLASLGMGFAAVLVFYFVMRSRAAVWPPPGTPPLPAGLWLSTALLIGTSLGLLAARRSLRHERPSMAARALLIALLAGFAFLLSQIANWWLAWAANLPPGRNMFSITFYLLTGLHAAHIIGGLVPLAIVTTRALRGRYSAARHAGVTYCAMYWHFLDAVWLVIFAALLLST